MLKKLTIAALLLSACADERVTRDEACQEQAEIWCLNVGHPNATCELSYYNHCAPLGVERDRAVNPALHELCVDDLACDTDEQHHAVPESCTRFWGQL